jgi:hypothetical protein
MIVAQAQDADASLLQEWYVEVFSFNFSLI